MHENYALSPIFCGFCSFSLYAPNVFCIGEYYFHTDFNIEIIVPRHHPYLNDVIAHFNAEIEMFKSNKP